MNDKEKQQLVSEIMRGYGKKGGASRAKTTTKAQRMAWGKIGAEKRWTKTKG